MRPIASLVDSLGRACLSDGWKRLRIGRFSTVRYPLRISRPPIQV